MVFHTLSASLSLNLNDILILLHFDIINSYIEYFNHIKTNKYSINKAKMTFSLNSDNIQILYFLILLLYTLTEVSLLFLNLQAAKKPLSNLPESIKKVYSEDTHEKSFLYTKDRTHLSIISTIFSSVLLFVVIYFSLLGNFDLYLRDFFESIYIRSCVFIIGVSLVFSILSLPFSLYSTFVIEERHGFNKTTFKLWLIDLLKSSILSLIILTPLLCFSVYFIENFSKNWWVYVFILVASFQIVLMLIFPTFIAPIFNKFEPLVDKELGDKINNLSKSLDFESKGIFQIDASKRSSHGNAYFAGFGKLRRIVLFDTLIDKLSHSEICAVLAHEIGHAKKKHIIKSIFLSLFFLLGFLYIASLLINSEEFFHAFGISTPSSYALLLLISIAFEPLLFFFSPLTSIFSRKNEYEADRFAVSSMKEASSLETALAKLSTESLSNLNPHPLYSFFHYSHPTLIERINAMREFEKSSFLS